MPKTGAPVRRWEDLLQGHLKHSLGKWCALNASAANKPLLSWISSKAFKVENKCKCLKRRLIVNLTTTNPGFWIITIMGVI